MWYMFVMILIFLTDERCLNIYLFLLGSLFYLRNLVKANNYYEDNLDKVHQ